MIESRSARACALAAAFAAFVFGRSEAQQACGDCRVVLDPVVTLGDTVGPGALDGIILDVQRDSRSRYWVVVMGQPPLVFGSDGSLLGRVGLVDQEDPDVYESLGGFYLPSYLIRAGDSIVVLDPSINRATVISPELEPIRWVDLGGRAARGAVLDWPERVVLGGLYRTPEAIGWPLHLANLSGPQAEIIRSFGSSNGEVRPADVSALNRHVAPSSTGGVWAAETEVVRIHGYDSDLSTARPLESNAGEPGRSLVQDVADDGRGRLWVYELAFHGGDNTERPQERSSVIHVFDIATRSLITMALMPEVILGGASEEEVFSHVTDRFGRNFVSVSRIRLEEGGS